MHRARQQGSKLIRPGAAEPRVAAAFVSWSNNKSLKKGAPAAGGVPGLRDTMDRFLMGGLRGVALR
jgi:hypothetical protein